jgi:membrane associated rhomboid family serine protease
MFNEPYEPDQPGSFAPKADSPAVRWLLALNIGVYLLQVTLVSPEKVFGALALDPASFPASWWTPVTYMFVHAGLLHISLNMITLWMFGSRLEAAWTTRRFTSFYIWCGVGGAVAHLLFAPGAALVGASAAVSGVLLAYALRWPEDRVYFFGFIPMRSRWLVFWLIATNLALGFSSQTLIGWKAHLGGLAFGWLYLLAASAGGVKGVGQWMRAIPDDPDTMPHAVPRSRPVHGRAEEPEDYARLSSTIVVDRRGAGQRTANLRNRSARLDGVLDKISRQGLHSLTSDERQLLDEASRELREADKRS